MRKMEKSPSTKQSAGRRHEIRSQRRPRLFRFGDRQVALPPFILQNKLLEGDLGCVGVKVGHGHVFGRPAAVYSRPVRARARARVMGS
jgi:hypothetical protein